MHLPENVLKSRQVRMLASPHSNTEADFLAGHGEVAQWLAHVPLYKKRKPTPLCGDSNQVPPGCFSGLPLITKADIRHDFPRNFLAEESDLDALLDNEEVELEHTSGTSEIRTPLLLPVGWWRQQENRALRLNPVVARILDEFPNARRATITSPVCSSEVSFKGVPSRCQRTVGETLYVSLSRFPFLWSEHDLARICLEIQEWSPQFLDVDPVYGIVFALYCERKGLRLPSLQFIICSYEFVSILHRRILQRVFGVPVLDLYGSTETGHLMMEFPGGRLIQSEKTAYLEVVNQGQDAIGELVVTTLTNPYMPLIRYWIGDLVEHHADGLFEVHGRVMDTFKTASGRVTTLQVDRCFAGLTGFAHYQLIQGRNNTKLRFISDTVGPSEDAIAELRQRLSGLLGQEVEVDGQSMVMPEDSGKFRLLYPAGD